MITRVGFVGVGIMGEPMAANLLRAGFDVTVVAHQNRAPVDRLVAAGAREAATIADVAHECEAVVTCVPNDAALTAVVTGEQGLLAGATEGLIIVDSSTVSPLTSQGLAQRARDQGVTLLDAPISGGQSGAQAGTLAIMVGGPEEAYDRVLPVLKAMGKSVTHVGTNGAALAVKLANNLIVAATMVAVSEAMTMASKAGVDPAITQEILANATARSFVVQEKVPKSLLVGNLQPGFKLALMHKDMGLALDFGKSLEVPMFATSLVQQLYTQAKGLGKGEMDSMAVSELYTEATGASLVARGEAE